MVGNNPYVAPVPNVNSFGLEEIATQLQDVRVESAMVAVRTLRDLSIGLHDDLDALDRMLDKLSHVWQAPSTKRGAGQVQSVQGYVQRLSSHANVLSAGFGGYVEALGTARARIPEPLPDSPFLTPAGALGAGPDIAQVEQERQQRTEEARQVMLDLIAAAQAADAATPPFEDLPDQGIDTSNRPTDPSGAGGGTGRVSVVGGAGSASAGPTPGAPDLSQGQGAHVGVNLGPVQRTDLSFAWPASPAPGPIADGLADRVLREAAPGIGAGGGAGPGAGGHDVGRGAGRDAGGSSGRGGQPGRGTAGLGRGGAASPVGAQSVSGRTAAGRLGGAGGGPFGAPGGARDDDDDYMHQRAAFLHADETADELSELTR